MGKTLRPGQVLWYRRPLPLKKRADMRTLLHFGAVDQRAWVYVNGLLAGTHTGGYTAFTLDITKLLREGENTLTVAVRDDTDTVPLARGKQKTKRGGIWYTPQSGIWQTVWAELVPERYIGSLLFTPELPEGRIRWQVFSAAPQGAKVSVCYQGEPVAEGGTDADGCGSAVIAPEQLHLWTPETPELYDVTVTLGDDTVKSYFAMRTVGTGQDAAGHPCLLLNGQPYFHHGVLDQGYWPDGLYTAPSDEALIYDIQLMKRLGFNMLRKHIKIEPMRWYYHCDRLGMLVWQDMPSGGGRYNLLTISAPLITGIHLKDSHYRLFARTDADGRDSFRQELDGDDPAAAELPVHRALGAVQRGLGAVRREADHAACPQARPHAPHRPRQRLARPGRERRQEPARILSSPTASGPTRRAAPSSSRSSAGTICRVAGHTWNDKELRLQAAIRRPRRWARPCGSSMKRRSFRRGRPGLPPTSTRS